MKPFWITFYSYKGGVGRSMALSNIAALLVKKGRRVVLIDFDLEAPGLDSFEEFACIVGKPGVVEYTTEFRHTGKAPEIEHFVHHCHLKDAPAGDLWIMPAGTKNASYNRERANLNWAELYDTGAGVPFVENWKAAIANHFKPDYVLVDSRTGLTDVAGICTLHLPDLVVMLFGLNDQNIKGIAAVAKTVRESNSGRIPQIHYVASPVPNMPAEKKNLVSERLDSARKAIGTEIGSLIGYSVSAALHEKLFALQDNTVPSSLVMGYQALLDKLIDYNRNGIDLITKEVESSISNSDAAKMRKLLTVLAADFSDRAEGCFLLSRLQLALTDRDAAVLSVRKALSIDPAHVKSYDWLLKHYQSEKAYDDALSICKAAISEKNRLSPLQLLSLKSDMGSVALTALKPDIAVAAYALAIETHKKISHSPAAWLTSLYFNYAEARRRAEGVPDISLWKNVIGFFEQGGENSNASPTVRVNRLQAMHIAYAVTGDIKRAKQTLRKAHDAARLLGRADDVFSVKTYTEVPVAEFLTINDEMLAALERGELWDGMKLPVLNRPCEAGFEVPGDT
ncbi:MAG: AAA family ATPase [Kiritimatiellae bacterium]|nr:AAA family ATPase [Kiritimatiellia bacterium]